MEHRYKEYIKESCSLLPMLEGALVQAIRVNVVLPEFNVVYFGTDKGVFSVQGEMGSEHLGIRKLELLPELTNVDGYLVCTYEPFECFAGKVIAQAHQIGEAWNGHGFEFCFKGLLDKTMLIQSIYSGQQPKEFDDCLRLGIGNYQYEYKNT